MIAPLRRRHRATIAALAVVVPLGYAAGLLARRPMPVEGGEPPPAGLARAAAVVPLAAGGIEVAVRAWSEGAVRHVELTPAASPRRPDVLVYAAGPWHFGDPRTSLAEGVRAEWLADMHLVGALDGATARRFALPEELGEEGALLVFYSLAHQELVGWLSFEGGD